MLAHLRRVKVDKLKELIRGRSQQQQGQGTPSRAAPPPPGGAQQRAANYSWGGRAPGYEQLPYQAHQQQIQVFSGHFLFPTQFTSRIKSLRPTEKGVTSVQHFGDKSTTPPSQATPVKIRCWPIFVSSRNLSRKKSHLAGNLTKETNF